MNIGHGHIVANLDSLSERGNALRRLQFESIQIGNEQVSFTSFSNDPEFVHTTEQLLIASYKRKGQCAWNRTPSTKKPGYNKRSKNDE